MFKTYGINGTEYPFLLDLLAWEEYEELTGGSFYSITEAKLKDLITVLYVGLVRGGVESEKPFGKSQEDFKKLISNKKPGEIMEEVFMLSGLFDGEEVTEEDSEKK